jgi:pimeloyl-ACP methyl ester carboxylesterase
MSLPRIRRRALLASGVLVAIALIGTGVWARSQGTVPRPNHAVSDPSLRARGVVIYAPSGTPRALVLFFGNDVGFWRPHQELAADLAREGYAVAGIDIRPLLAGLPEGHPVREEACAAAVRDLVRRVRAELALDSIPLVIGGHSLGAELALWAAANAGLGRLAGTLALSPGSRSHLRITASDILMTSEPRGTDSFAVADQIAAATGTGQRVAIIRGSRDKLRGADESLLDAGGASARRFSVPLASHSLRDLTLARYLIHDAMRWLLEPRPGAGAAAVPPRRTSP